MTHFIERKDLIRWVEQNCTRKSVVRAMQEGSVELLGGFNNLGPSPTRPGWIILVTSDTGKTWIIEVVARKYPVKFGIYITECQNYSNDSVLWEYWMGEPAANPLYSGDNPTEYVRLRDERQREIAEKNRTSEDTK